MRTSVVIQFSKMPIKSGLTPCGTMNGEVDFESSSSANSNTPANHNATILADTMFLVKHREVPKKNAEHMMRQHFPGPAPTRLSYRFFRENSVRALVLSV